MLWAVEELGPAVDRRVSQWDRGLLTRLEAFSGLLADFIFTLLEHPDSRQAVAAVVDRLRPPVAAELADFLAEKRTPGGWEWPPIGALGSPVGQTVYRPAEPVEVAVYETLFGWLQSQASGVSRGKA